MSLKEFIDAKRKEIMALKKEVPLSELKKKSNLIETRNFLEPFNKEFILLSEIKKASPSEGIIDENADIVEIAKQYEKGGAGIISILTDKKFFNGDISYIPKIKEIVSLPILRKDFIIDKYQIYESRVYGADAILLIVGVLSLYKLEKFIDLSHKLGMECLIEVHNEKELKKALKFSEKIRIIGINNRNLDTLETNLSVTENLIHKIPKDKIVISESGIKDKEDVKKLKNLGACGILIGTSLMKAENKILAIKEILA